MKLKDENNVGVTLIALIITIIVMLILVAVSVRIAINTGLLKSAGDATKGWKIAQDQEQNKVEAVDKIIDKEIYGKMEPTTMYAALYSDGALAFYRVLENIPEERNGASLVKKSVDISDTADIDNDTIKTILFWPYDEEVAQQISSVVIEEEVAPKSTRSLFRGLVNIESIEGIDKLYTNNVTTMYAMFYQCRKLKNIDVSRFNTENVVNMEYMFNACESLINLNVSNLNTSKVTSMHGMFSDCTSLKSVNIKGWDTSKVQDMGYMFGGSPAGNPPWSMVLEEIVGIEDLDVSSVQSMQRMFRACRKLKKLDLHKWDVSNVQLMLQTFNCCESLSDLNIDGWKMKSATNIEYMFNKCYSLNTTITLDVDPSKITTYKGTFSETALNDNCTLIVNYTSSVADAIDNIIATGNANNVKKGIQVD